MRKSDFRVVVRDLHRIMQRPIRESLISAVFYGLFESCHGYLVVKLSC